MEANTIVEGNKLIAEFMGLEYTMKKYWKIGDVTGNNQLFDLHYHASWDWLMPVVEKIDALPKVSFQYQSFENGNAQILISVNGTVQAGIMFDKDQIKDAYYKAVVQFITWYNQQQNIK